MKRRRTLDIALAAVCAALILLFLWLSVVVRFGTVAFYILCSLILMVPLAKKRYFSAVFAYICSSLLAFFIVGDIFSILGFVAYFGPMTLLSVTLKEKNVKLFISLPVKIVYMLAVLAVFYFVTDTIFIDFSALGFTLHFAVVAVVGTLILVALDFVMLYIFRFVKEKAALILKD